MQSELCPYQSLINSFDAVGWVPTVRGSLLLSLFNRSESILGDVDKFSVEFKNYNGFTQSRYLVASSLFTVDDSKLGPKYSNTCRYIFRGTINDTNRQLYNTQAISFCQDKEFLIGKLSIIVQNVNILSDAEKRPKNNQTETERYFLYLPDDQKQSLKNQERQLCETERNLLINLKSLSDKEKEFQEAFKKKAKSCGDLQTIRTELKRLYDNVETCIIAIEQQNIYAHPIYKFDVVLSRDGILFFKDATDNYCVGQNNNKKILMHDTYRKAGTAADFTQNIPIHRIFKIAMNYIKFLFHNNYHHNEEDDNFLPATNLHPIKQSRNLEKIVNHQLESFLRPVTELKRDDKVKTSSCNPLGLLQYADSFLQVFENNKFISPDKADIQRKFIEKQKNEIEVFLLERNTIISFLITQQNWLVTITFAIAFLLASITVCELLYKIPDIKAVVDSYPIWMTEAIIIVGGLAAGWFIKYIAEMHDLAKRFKKRKSTNWLNKLLNKDSNLETNRCSCSYLFRLRLIQKLKHNQRNTIRGLWWIVLFIIFVISLCYVPSLLTWLLK
jgi:hypothetical protein